MGEDAMSEAHAKAIGDAIRILSEAGYDVSRVNDSTPTNEGVAFNLHVRAPADYKPFWTRVDQVKSAAMELPAVGMDGEPVEEADDE